jgi:hypothetical protein
MAELTRLEQIETGTRKVGRDELRPKEASPAAFGSAAAVGTKSESMPRAGAKTRRQEPDAPRRRLF